MICSPAPERAERCWLREYGKAVASLRIALNPRGEAVNDAIVLVESQHAWLEGGQLPLHIDRIADDDLVPPVDTYALR